jgi:hypothetical protein
MRPEPGERSSKDEGSPARSGTKHNVLTKPRKSRALRISYLRIAARNDNGRILLQNALTKGKHADRRAAPHVEVAVEDANRVSSPHDPFLALEQRDAGERDVNGFDGVTRDEIENGVEIVGRVRQTTREVVECSQFSPPRLFFFEEANPFGQAAQLASHRHESNSSSGIR